MELVEELKCCLCTCVCITTILCWIFWFLYLMIQIIIILLFFLSEQYFCFGVYNLDNCDKQLHLYFQIKKLDVL